MVPLPSVEARQAMMEKLLVPEKCEELDYAECVSQLKDYSGSDIRLVCKEAAMRPLRRLMAELESVDASGVDNWSLVVDPAEVPAIPLVTREDVREAVQVTKKSSVLPPEKYEAWEREFGSI